MFILAQTKGTIVNQALAYLYGGSLGIALPIPIILKVP